MPDTYISFVVGYLLAWVVLFVGIGLVLRKITLIEKKLENLHK